jgi:exopolyphosphatase/pppGpp-phosphohydrolase
MSGRTTDSNIKNFLKELNSNPIMLTKFSYLTEVNPKDPEDIKQLSAFINEVLLAIYSGNYKFGNMVDKMATLGGGNINKLINLAKKKDERQISHAKLKEIFAQLSIYSLEERITILGLNPDRADVIIPATEIFLFVMKHANIDKILVPQIGLSDGIIHLLYEEFLRNSNSIVKRAGFE